MHHLTFKPLAIKLPWVIRAGLYALTMVAFLA
jgi:hypothetical protein